MNQRLILLRGLPGSGKTSWARELCLEYPEFVRVNRDDLRPMLHGRKWSESDETVTTRVRDAIIVQVLLLGRSVVVDDTNIAPHTRAQVAALGVPFGIVPEIHDIETPIEDCIQRDALRSHPVGAERIREMAAELETQRK